MDGNPRYIRIADFAKLHGVCNKTMVRWCNAGKFEFTRTEGGHRLFENPSYKQNNVIVSQGERIDVIYVRVSSQKQKVSGDLERQALFMLDKFPKHKVVRDIGSGLNFKRKGLLSLLGQVKEGYIRQIVVATRDRLSRFGFDFFEWFCKSNGTEIMVLDTSSGSKEQELTEDLLAILHVFNCRINGMRRYTIGSDKVQEIKINQKLDE